MDVIRDCVVGYFWPVVIVIAMCFVLPKILVYMKRVYLKYLPIAGFILATIGSYSCSFEVLMAGFIVFFSGIIALYLQKKKTRN